MQLFATEEVGRVAQGSGVLFVATVSDAGTVEAVQGPHQVKLSMNNNSVVVEIPHGSTAVTGRRKLYPRSYAQQFWNSPQKKRTRVDDFERHALPKASNPGWGASVAASQRVCSASDKVDCHVPSIMVITSLVDIF